ncbi:hypothetical protein NC651_034261 [Populus alba x Populus x berolinensis]|nr:hypothetical protein NC651_034261 [Populus alba x Populus x berolinensis]
MKTEIFYMASDAHKGEGIPLIYGFSAFCSIMILVDSNGYLSSLLIKCSNRNLREVDLDETPITQNIRLRSRMEALTKTVAELTMAR